MNPLRLSLTYSNSADNSNVGAGVLPGRADWVISPKVSAELFIPDSGKWVIIVPTMAGTGTSQCRHHSSFQHCQVFGMFFIAAEAAVKGAATKP